MPSILMQLTSLTNHFYHYEVLMPPVPVLLTYSIDSNTYLGYAKYFSSIYAIIAIIEISSKLSFLKFFKILYVLFNLISDLSS